MIALGEYQGYIDYLITDDRACSSRSEPSNLRGLLVWRRDIQALLSLSLDLSSGGLVGVGHLLGVASN